jgi:hypothetical protein
MVLQENSGTTAIQLSLRNQRRLKKLKLLNTRQSMENPLRAATKMQVIEIFQT